MKNLMLTSRICLYFNLILFTCSISLTLPLNVRRKSKEESLLPLLVHDPPDNKCVTCVCGTGILKVTL